MTESARELINSEIEARKVMIFSKTWCPYCKKAKRVFAKYVGNVLPDDDYKVMEIEGLSDFRTMQDILEEMTGSRTVPRVFIDGKCIGGGNETEDLDTRVVWLQLLNQTYSEHHRIPPYSQVWRCKAKSRL
ncbi:hypothetical protein ScPMuIL_018870 [Solemya velum]